MKRRRTKTRCPVRSDPPVGGVSIPIIWLMTITVVICANSWAEEDVAAKIVVEAAVGKSARLPCDFTPDNEEDRVYMILWFRLPNSKPFYTFDVRGRAFIHSKHWSDPLVFGERALFITDIKKAGLHISNLQSDDEGKYRCRVDFKNSPTRNFQIKLNIIVPPHKILLYDLAGRDTAGVIGPLKEGDNFELFCEVRGGHPVPNVTWIFQNQVIAHKIVTQDGRTIISKVNLENAERGWLLATIHCRASNTVLMKPHERIASVEMFLRPLLVIILTKPRHVRAGHEVHLTCVSQGSRPHAQITWSKNNYYIEKGEQKDVSNDTTIQSRLTFTPTAADNNQVVKCRAENTVLGIAIEDSFVLDVYHNPIIKAALGRVMDPDRVQEGNSAFFDCQYTINPKESRLEWLKNGNVIKRTHAEKLLINLILRNVSKADSGLYACQTITALGPIRSNQVYLRVQYSPKCVEEQPVLIGVRLYEKVNLRCSVDADPNDNLKFAWKFISNFQGEVNIGSSRYVARGQGSVLEYVAASRRDYGTILCKATNAIGEQRSPCVFQIVPAAPPEAPFNCTVRQIPRWLEDRISVKCFAGYDGGIPQIFTLYAISKRPRMFKNATANRDNIVWLNVSFSALETMTSDETLAVIARNAVGQSTPILFRQLKLNYPTVPTTMDPEIGITQVPIWLAMVGMVTTIVIVTILCVLIFVPCNGGRQKQLKLLLNKRRKRVLTTIPTTDEVRAETNALNTPKPDEQAPEALKPPRVLLSTSNNTRYGNVMPRMVLSRAEPSFELGMIVHRPQSRGGNYSVQIANGQEAMV